MRVNNIDDEDDDNTAHVPNTSDTKHGGSGSTGPALEDEDGDDDENQQTRKKPKDSGAPQTMTLRRALILYLVPLYMAWFGGIISDLL